MNLLKPTPVEIYDSILVKREDLATDPPAPPFSKVRGLIPYLTGLKKQRIRTVGYTETSISMAGWGVAWACEKLGLKAVIFDPQYKNTPPLLAMHRKQWSKFPDTHIIPIKAGMAKVNWYLSRKLLAQYDPEGILLPLGLPFSETIEATAQEAKKTQKKSDFKTVVVNVGSGTIAAGVWKGLTKGTGTIYGIMGRTGSVPKKMKQISIKAGMEQNGTKRKKTEQNGSCAIY